MSAVKYELDFFEHESKDGCGAYVFSSIDAAGSHKILWATASNGNARAFVAMFISDQGWSKKLARERIKVLCRMRAGSPF